MKECFSCREDKDNLKQCQLCLEYSCEECFKKADCDEEACKECHNSGDGEIPFIAFEQEYKELNGEGDGERGERIRLGRILERYVRARNRLLEELKGIGPKDFEGIANATKKYVKVLEEITQGQREEGGI